MWVRGAGPQTPQGIFFPAENRAFNVRTIGFLGNPDFGIPRVWEIEFRTKSGTVTTFFESYSGRKPLWGPTPFVLFAGVPPPLAQKNL